MVCLVTDGQTRLGQEYADLYKAINALAVWWHHLDSTWMMDARLNGQRIVELLRPNLDGNDHVLVIRVTKSHQS